MDGSDDCTTIYLISLNSTLKNALHGNFYVYFTTIMYT